MSKTNLIQRKIESQKHQRQKKLGEGTKLSFLLQADRNCEKKRRKFWQELQDPSQSVAFAESRSLRTATSRLIKAHHISQKRKVCQSLSQVKGKNLNQVENVIASHQSQKESFIKIASTAEDFDKLSCDTRHAKMQSSMGLHRQSTTKGMQQTAADSYTNDQQFYTSQNSFGGAIKRSSKGPITFANSDASQQARQDQGQQREAILHQLKLSQSLQRKLSGRDAINDNHYLLLKSSLKQQPVHDKRRPFKLYNNDRHANSLSPPKATMVDSFDSNNKVDDHPLCKVARAHESGCNSVEINPKLDITRNQQQQTGALPNLKSSFHGQRQQQHLATSQVNTNSVDTDDSAFNLTLGKSEKVRRQFHNRISLLHANSSQSKDTIQSSERNPYEPLDKTPDLTNKVHQSPKPTAGNQLVINENMTASKESTLNSHIESHQLSCSDQSSKFLENLGSQVIPTAAVQRSQEFTFKHLAKRDSKTPHQKKRVFIRESNEIMNHQNASFQSQYESLFSLKRNSADTELQTPRMNKSRGTAGGNVPYSPAYEYDAVGEERRSFNQNQTEMGQASVAGNLTTNMQTRRDSIQSNKATKSSFTYRRRTKLKGMAVQYKFMKDGSKEHRLRCNRIQANSVHREQIKDQIANLDAYVKHAFLQNQEQFVSQSHCKRTKFDLESALYHKFDIRKKAKNRPDEDQTWSIAFDEYLDHKQFAEMDVDETEFLASYDPCDGETFAYNTFQELISNNKVEKLDGDRVHLITKLPDARQNMAPTSQSLAYESKIPIQIIYNRKIEQIKIKEYERRQAPSALHYDISDSLTGIESKKRIKLEPEGAEQPVYFDIDFANVRDNPRCFDTQLEKMTRFITDKDVGPPIKLTDYTKNATDNSGIDRFMQDMRARMKKVNIKRAHFHRQISRDKTKQEMRDQFTQQILGMRRGKQFNFTKLPQTELEKDPNHELNESIKTESLHSDSSIDEAGKMSIVASLESNRFTKDQSRSKYGTHQQSKEKEIQSRNITHRNGISPQEQFQFQRDNQTTQRNREKSVVSVSVENADQSSTFENLSEVDSSSKQLTPLEQLKRQRLITNMATVMGHKMLMRDREALLGLTVGQAFKSKYAKIKMERALKERKNAEMSIYEGRVPLHQRLVLLCTDFLESTWDFDIMDMFNFQTSINRISDNIKQEKVKILKHLIKELYKKYQLEVIRPDLGYIIDKYQTAYEKYKTEAQEVRRLESQKTDILINFKHADYDKSKLSNKGNQSKVNSSLQSLEITEQEDLVPEQLKLSLDNKAQSMLISRKGSESYENEPVFRRSVALRKPLLTQRTSSYGPQINVFTRRQTILNQRRQSNLSSIITDEVSSESENQKLPKKALNKSNDKNETETWFSMLEWEDDKRFDKFGRNKDINQEANLKQKSSTGTRKSSPKNQTSKKPSTSQRNESIICRLAEESRKMVEDGYNQSKLRKEIVKNRSMFKGNLSIKEIFNDEKVLKSKITGDQITTNDE